MNDLLDIANELEEQLNHHEDIECWIEDELSGVDNAHIMGFIYTDDAPNGLLFNLDLNDEYILSVDFFISGIGFPLDLEKLIAIRSFAHKNEEKYNVIFDDSSANVTIDLKPLFYSKEKVNLIYDIIHEFSINSDVVELKKNYDIVYKCPKCNGDLFFEPLDGIKNHKYYCEKCNEFYDVKDIIKGLEEVKIIND